MFEILSYETHEGFRVATVRCGDGNLEYVAMSMTKVDGLGLPVILAEGDDKEQVISQAKGANTNEVQLDRSPQKTIW